MNVYAWFFVAVVLVSLAALGIAIKAALLIIIESRRRLQRYIDNDADFFMEGRVFNKWAGHLMLLRKTAELRDAVCGFLGATWACGDKGGMVIKKKGKGKDKK